MNKNTLQESRVTTNLEVSRNRKLFIFNKFYFLWTVILFCTEVLIAKYVNDSVIRPFGGDFLVVILIYCFVKSFCNTPVVPTAIGVLIFSFLIETMQYFHLVDLLGLGNNKLARIVIGTSFSWIDLVAYAAGIGFLLLLEFYVNKSHKAA